MHSNWKLNSRTSKIDFGQSSSYLEQSPPIAPSFSACKYSLSSKASIGSEAKICDGETSVRRSSEVKSSDSGTNEISQRDLKTHGRTFEFKRESEGTGK